MALAFRANGTQSTGTTSATPAYPATPVAGELHIMAVVSKYAYPTTPAGWTLGTNAQASGGFGASGLDSGLVYVSLYYRIATGSESGTVTVTLTGGNQIAAFIFAYSKAAGATWDIAFSSGSDNTVGTAWSVTLQAIEFLTGDLCLILTGVNTDIANWSAELLTATGITFGTMVERFDLPNSQGDDSKVVTAEIPVTTGAAGAVVPTYTMTGTAAGTNGPAGATVLMRLREAFGGGGTPATKRMTLLGVG